MVTPEQQRPPGRPQTEAQPEDRVHRPAVRGAQHKDDTVAARMDLPEADIADHQPRARARRPGIPQEEAATDQDAAQLGTMPL